MGDDVAGAGGGDMDAAGGNMGKAGYCSSSHSTYQLLVLPHPEATQLVHVPTPWPAVQSAPQHTRTGRSLPSSMQRTTPLEPSNSPSADDG